MFLELCIILSSHKRKRKCHAVIETYVFERIVMFSAPTDIGPVKGLYSSCAGHQYSLSKEVRGHLSTDAK
jgi:hypothetical protein